MFCRRACSKRLRGYGPGTMGDLKDDILYFTLSMAQIGHLRAVTFL